MKSIWTKAFSLVLALATASAADEAASDVVIYGATSGGVTAAVQVARMGRSVVLVEPGHHVGGLTSGGLGMTDAGNKEVIGGLSREFYQRIRKHYAQDSAWKWEKREGYTHMGETPDALWRFEPRVAEAIYRQMLTEAKVTLVEGERLDLKAGVVKEGTELKAIKMESGKTFRGRRFIDASYEGDLMAKAGVKYHVGREANSVYGETINGVQVKNATKHQFVHDVDPYVKPGDPKSGLLPGVQSGPPGEDGTGDRRIQAYNYRMCLTDVPENQAPFPKPAGYEPLRYELMLRYLQAGWRKIWGNHQMMPNRKTDTNNDGAFSTDNIGMNYDYPEGDYAVRDRILAEHVTYQQGLMYFLANDPRVPDEVRKDVARWGLAKDEFTGTGNWPHQIYVREARRMISDYVHAEADCRRTRPTPEPVGMGSYNMDSHNTQRYVDAGGHARNEGDIQVSPGGPYPVSWRSLRPRAEECTNLLVPVCLSCSHIAYGSVRMEPVFMILGQSAATAACLSLDAGCTVQAVDYEKLKARLLADGQVLEFKGKTAATKGGVDPKSLPGIILDDATAEFSDGWGESHATPGYVGAGYHHNGDAGGRATFRWTPDADGVVTVGLTWTALPNRAKNVAVNVAAAGEPLVLILDQSRAPTGGLFQKLGTVKAVKGQPLTVSLSAPAGAGHVIADAVQILPVRP